MPGKIIPSRLGRVDVSELRIDSAVVSATAAQIDEAAGAAAGFAGRKVATLTLSGDTLATAKQAWQNPEAGAILVEKAILVIATASTGASTLDVGCTATSADTLSDTLLDGVSGTPAALKDSTNDTDNGTNGLAKAQSLAAGKWVTVSEASGAAEGLVGTLYIYYTVA